MSLDLDERQRAILLEMGVRVWSPAPVPARELALAAPELAPAVASVVQAARSVAPASPLSAIETIAIDAIHTGAIAQKHSKIEVTKQGAGAPPELANGIAAMDWPTLARSVASCQACKLCTGRRAPVFGDPAAETPAQADWLVVGEPPDESEERLAAPFAGPAGQLLDNMLKAVGVSRQGAPGSGATAAYVTNVVKCRPAALRNPEAQELATCENYLRREVALVQPKVILAMGRFAAQSLLQGSLPDVARIPLGKLRGQIHHYQGVPVVVTYHPSYLLRTQADKARAWADLCLALTLG